MRAAIGVAGLVLGGLVAVLVTEGTHPLVGTDLHILVPVIAWSFIGTGLFAWARRPENRTGVLMVAVGFAWLVSQLIVARGSVLPTVGRLTYLLPYAVLLHLLLVFPAGRAQGRLEGALVASGYALCVGFQALLEAVRHDHGAFDALSAVQAAVSIVALGLVASVLVRRWRAAGGAQRHVLAPVYAAGAVIVVTLVLTLVADLTDLDEGVEQAVDMTARVAMACVPFGFLIGLARSRFSRAVAVSALVERLGERRRPLRDALAEALGDPELALAFRVGDGYVDAGGEPVALPDGGWTPVERDGRPVGAILHDPALADEEPEVLRAVAGAAALALDNERLEVELRARIAELRESRTRMVRAADEERRRLERDLHDGAQQRLVALALTLRLARGRAEGELATLLDEASTELQAATAELRELARGIHPAVLTERGLAPALGALAGRAPVPVELGAVPEERLPAGVESTAYFVVAEALTNASRYARATHAEVEVRRVNGSVTVEVRDDGVGGADPAAGSGLRGLADRVSALDGRLDVDSPPGGGTTVRAVLPCGS